MTEKFSSNFVQTYTVDHDGHFREVTEAISIRNGEGHKTVRYRNNGKVKETVHKLSRDEIHNIMNKKFMPDLFKPCHDECNSKDGVPDLAPAEKRARKGSKKTKRTTKKKDK